MIGEVVAPSAGETKQPRLVSQLIQTIRGKSVKTDDLRVSEMVFYRCLLIWSLLVVVYDKEDDYNNYDEDDHVHVAQDVADGIHRVNQPLPTQFFGY